MRTLSGHSTQVRPVTICAVSRSYGPAGKAIAIAKSLAKRGVKPSFLGRGIAHELVVRSRRDFEEVVEGGPFDDRAYDLLRSSRIVVSVMDAEFAQVASRLGASVHVVDSLSWMWDRVPAPYSNARRHWIQTFVDKDEHLANSSSATRLIGPVVTPRGPRDPSAASSKLIINLGGCEDRLPGLEEGDPYPGFIVRGVMGSGITQHFQETKLLAGSCRVKELQQQFEGCGIEFCSVPHETATREFETAAVVLSSPGLTATLECFQVKTPVFFLPPHFYSQWWNLMALRAHGVAPGAMHWQDLSPGRPVRHRAAQEDRAAALTPIIEELCRSQSAAAALRRSLSGYLELDRQALADKQRNFFESLGRNGAEVIAEDILWQLAGSS